jgi:hypothetical protein
MKPLDGASFSRPCQCAVLMMGIGCLTPSALSAATIWNGPTMTFTKAASADPTLEANQDRMTTNVWITRGNVFGLYNAKTETGYTHNLSPADTEWAYGELTNHATLTYQSWEQMFGGNVGGGPPSTVGKSAVVHLKTDDIYLSIKMNSWGSGSLSGGGFSYTRSTPGAVVNPPSPPFLTNSALLPDGSLRFSFTSTPGFVFSVFATPNLALPASNWTALGTVTESPPGTYQFVDAGAATNTVQRFYRVQWP